ncbi:MAG: RnfABCDGE type electron transport complex subunit B, partial [Nitrosomonas sp.]|nr:RnfABCDGE type electron transport complex subunit B [Nitrosomonas sp.]
IGCTFCIRACPVDAIAGAAKQMHTVIADECTGCELCVAPCPMDCIQMIPAETVSDEAKLNAANVARERHQFRLQRLERNACEQAARFDKKVKKVVQTPVSDEARKKATIQAALKRAAAAKAQAAAKKNHPAP